jgi:hypothetical protein
MNIQPDLRMGKSEFLTWAAPAALQLTLTASHNA